LIYSSKIFPLKFIFGFCFFSFLFFFVTVPYIQADSANPDIFAVDEVLRKYDTEAEAFDLADYNNYQEKVVKDLGTLDQLQKREIPLNFSKGIYKFTSYFKSETKGKEFESTEIYAPQFVYLDIDSITGSFQTNYNRELQPENYFYLRNDRQLLITLIDLRATQELTDETFTAKDIFITLEKVELTPTGKAWFVDEESEEIFGKELEDYVKAGGTLFKYGEVSGDYKNESREKGSVITINTALRTLPKDELENRLTEILKADKPIPGDGFTELAISFLVLALALLIIFVPLRLNLVFLKNLNLTTNFFENLASLLGIKPFKIINLGMLVLSIIFILLFLTQFLPYSTIVTGPNAYKKEAEWYRFFSAADFNVLSFPNIQKELEVEGEFISDDSLYLKTYSSARTFNNTTRLVRVSGIDLSKDFVAEKTINNTNYGYYKNKASEIANDYVFDSETLNMDYFIKEEIVEGNAFDGLFTQVNKKFGVSKTALKLYGIDKFGIFIATEAGTSLPLNLSLNLANKGVGLQTTVGGNLELYKLDGTEVYSQDLTEVQTNLNFNLAEGVYYLSLSSFEGEISELNITSANSARFALDWRLFGRKRGVSSNRCDNSNYVLVDEDWLSTLREVDSCALFTWLEKENEIADMYTSDMFNVFIDTIPLSTTDFLVTNNHTTSPANVNTYLVTLYSSAPGKLDFETEFSFKNFELNYGK
jgi:hypothetical protein